jgi:hypothetical protein
MQLYNELNNCNEKSMELRHLTVAKTKRYDVQDKEEMKEGTDCVPFDHDLSRRNR